MLPLVVHQNYRSPELCTQILCAQRVRGASAARARRWLSIRAQRSALAWIFHARFAMRWTRMEIGINATKVTWDQGVCVRVCVCSSRAYISFDAT